MELDSVAYLFDRAELILLFRLLKCSNLPFPPLEEEIDEEAALDRLSYLISGNREALAVDRVIAFLLLTMDRAPFCLSACGGAQTALFRTDTVSIVLLERGRRWLLAPFPSFPDARSLMLDSLRRLHAPLTLRTRDGSKALHFQSVDAALQAAEQLLPLKEEDS